MKKRIMAALKTNDAQVKGVVFLSMMTAVMVASHSGLTYRIILAVAVIVMMAFICNLSDPIE